MSRASREALGELHGALADILTDRLRSGEATASDMNVARQFLKDNGIEALIEKSDKLQGLLDSLPDLEDSQLLT